MLSDSVASSTDVLPGATRDSDFIVHLKTENVDALIGYFSEKYYCDKDAVLDAIKNKSMFKSLIPVLDLKLIS